MCAQVEGRRAANDRQVRDQRGPVAPARLALGFLRRSHARVGDHSAKEDLGLVRRVVGGRRAAARALEDPRQRRLEDDHESRRGAVRGPRRPAPPVRRSCGRRGRPGRSAPARGPRPRRSSTWPAKVERADAARPLVAAAVVGHDVEGLRAPSQPREGAATVEAPVYADDHRPGVRDAVLEQGEPGDGRVTGDEAQRRRSRGVHAGNLAAARGIAPRVSRRPTPRLVG